MKWWYAFLLLAVIGTAYAKSVHRASPILEEEDDLSELVEVELQGVSTRHVKRNYTYTQFRLSEVLSEHLPILLFRLPNHFPPRPIPRARYTARLLARIKLAMRRKPISGSAGGDSQSTLRFPSRHAAL